MKKYQKVGKTSVKKKDIPLDTICIVVNNTGYGRFVYRHEKLNKAIDLQEPTSFEEVTLGDLKIMRQFSKSVFTDYSILIVDVMDEEYSLKDVYALLDLMLQYEELSLMVKNEDGFDTGMFEHFAISSTMKSFEKAINLMSKEAKQRLFQAFVHAYKCNAISDRQTAYDKAELIQRITRMNDDIIDVLRYDSSLPNVSVQELL
ncbi:TPA: hypothetical protein QCX73_005704 [Bacillus mycoides]|nr:hypothetical protein [Bacillus mycoides]HDR7630978.1 hypothetical protein [Bacillus mycoides]